jgi:NAD-dependent deacetylase
MKIVVLTGAGISQESGIKTFRDSGGLWENHDIHEVAHPAGWAKNKPLVNRFYNERRKQLHTCQPNKAHIALAELEKHHDVAIITQNVDDLHERGGSSNILHLHGELFKIRDEYTNEVFDCTVDLADDAVSSEGNPLRPHIVWFEEGVPNFPLAQQVVAQAELLLIVGTSLEVYPAAILHLSVPKGCKVHLFNAEHTKGFTAGKQHIGKAGSTLPEFIKTLI